MDTVTFEPPVVRRTLDFLGLTARHFGGARAVIDCLARWSARWPADSTVSLLDVGTGGAEIPSAIVRWARAHRRRVRVVALDLVPEIAALARANAAAYPEIEVRCADAFSLRASGETFDYVTASLFLHHIPSPRIDDVLHLFDALSRRGVIVSDLSRSAASYWAVSALAFLAGNHVVRHDAPLSVRRSFTPAELAHFAARAGLPYLRAAAAPWFRLTLAGEKP
jgi:2-polyprenyl-3-methyl-5-hydroxy-6-metoxy-1,4-benzoquinol methylase